MRGKIRTFRKYRTSLIPRHNLYATNMTLFIDVSFCSAYLCNGEARQDWLSVLFSSTFQRLLPTVEESSGSAMGSGGTAVTELPDLYKNVSIPLQKAHKRITQYWPYQNAYTKQPTYVNERVVTLSMHYGKIVLSCLFDRCYMCNLFEVQEC